MTTDLLDDELRELFRAQAAVVRPGAAEWDDVMVDDLAERRDRRRFGGLVAAAAAVILVVTGVIWLRSSGGTPAAGGGGPAVSWSTEQVSLTASSFSIRLGTGETFTSAGADMDVSSDPGFGTPGYQTLELDWREHGVPMRWNLYFASDGATWWVSEMRTYDGSSGGEWITFGGGEGGKAQYFRSPVGSCFEGDVDMRSSDGSTSSRLLVGAMRLCPFRTGTNGAGPRPDSTDPEPAVPSFATTTIAPTD